MRVFGRGGLIWLLAHEIRLSLAARTGGAWWQTGLVILVLLAMAAGLGWITALGLIGAARADGAIGHALISGAILAALALSVFSAAFLSIEALYRRGDLDLLFSSPLDPRIALSVRAIGVAATSGYVVLIAALAAALWLAAWDAWRLTAILPFAIGLAALSGALGLGLCLALFRTIGPRAARTLMQVLGIGVGVTTLVLSQLWRLSFEDDAPSQAEAAFSRILAMAPPPDSLVWVPARAAQGAPIELGLWLAASLGVFFATTLGFGRRFAHDAAAIAALGRTRTTRVGADRRDRRLGSGLAAGVIAKEWRLVLRDPARTAQALARVIYIVPALLPSFVALGSEESWRQEAGAPLAAGAITLIAGMAGGLFAWLMTSAEDAADLIRSAPVAPARIERLKVLAALGPSVGLAALAAGALAFTAPAPAAWGVGFAIAAAYGNASVHARQGKPARRSGMRGGEPLAPWWVTLLSGLANTAWAGAAGLAAAGWAPFALIPAVAAIGITLAMLDRPPALEHA